MELIGAVERLQQAATNGFAAYCFVEIGPVFAPLRVPASLNRLMQSLATECVSYRARYADLRPST